MREQVSKIEMYKKSMNNNYRNKSISAVLSMNNKTSHSVWSCGGPFCRPVNRRCVLYTLRRKKKINLNVCVVPVIIVSGFKRGGDVFFKVTTDIGNKRFGLKCC